MPRRTRAWLRDVPLHVIQRWNNRAACFFADEDYQCYLHWLKTYLDKYQCALHAYVLMTNHVHLLVTPGKAGSVSRLMQSLGRRYVQYINRQYKRSGTLWEGRFKASLVQAETYLLTCSRYIELNPVRAQMVTQPQDYRWSSYRCHAMNEGGEWLTDHPVYTGLGVTAATRAMAYQALFRTELDAEDLSTIRGATNRSGIIGSERFREEIAVMLGRKTSPAKKKGRPRRDASSGVTGEQQELGL